jgi:polyisoprenoid-binding protein YceI
MSTSLARGEHVQTMSLHAEAAFAVRELGLYTVRGTIPVTSAVVHLDDDGHPLRVEATLDPGGIDTGNKRRDADLRGKRFLDVEHHPSMTFVGDEVSTEGDGWTVGGELTVRGVTSPVSLRVDATDPADPSRALVATTQLDRRACGVVRVPAVVIANTVKVTIRAGTVASAGRPFR